MLDKLNVVVSRNELYVCLKERKVNLGELSELEKITKNCSKSERLNESLKNLLYNGVRVNTETVIVENINPEKIISSVLSVLDLIRSL